MRKLLSWQQEKLQSAQTIVELVKVSLTEWLQKKEYLLAKEIVVAIQGLDMPERHAAWLDQVSRSSLSVLSNLSEFVGKNASNAYRVFRGEVFEAAAQIDSGPIPQELKVELLDKMNQILAIVDTKVEAQFQAVIDELTLPQPS